MTCGCSGPPCRAKRRLWVRLSACQTSVLLAETSPSSPGAAPACRCFPSSWELFPSSSEGSCRGWFSSTPSLFYSSGGAYRRALPVPRMCVGFEVGLCLLTLGATWRAGLGEHLQSVLLSSSSLLFIYFYPCRVLTSLGSDLPAALCLVPSRCAELPAPTGAGETPRGCPGSWPWSSRAGECCLLGALRELLWVTLGFTGGERGRTGLVLSQYPPPLLVKWHRAGKSPPCIRLCHCRADNNKNILIKECRKPQLLPFPRSSCHGHDAPPSQGRHGCHPGSQG